MSKDQLPDLLRQMVCRDNDELDIFGEAADEIERLRARLAEVEREEEIVRTEDMLSDAARVEGAQTEWREP